MDGKKTLIVFGLLTVYLLLGGVVFHFTERDNEEAVRVDLQNFTQQLISSRPCLTEEDVDAIVTLVIRAYDNGVIVRSNSSSESNWDFASSIFFSVTVVTTIGYGHISPATDGGRIFFVFYALIGIPLCLVLLSDLGVKLSERARALGKKLTCCQKRPRLNKLLKSSIVAVVSFVFMLMIPAIIFMAIEDWDYGTSLYYTFVTLTTIGFGDYVPGLDISAGAGRAIYRICTSLWILIGLAWLSGIISSIQTALAGAVERVGNKEDTDDDEKNAGIQKAEKEDIASKNISQEADMKDDKDKPTERNSPL